MKVLFLTSGRNVPTSRFRVLQYVPHLRNRGHECTVSPSLPAKYAGLPLLGNRLSELPRIAVRLCDCLRAWWSSFDVVMLERELLSSGIFFVERLLRKLVPTIVLDVDDGIFLLHPQKFAALASMADAVIAGNSLLRAKIEPINPNTTVIPTSLDLNRYTIKAADSRSTNPIVIGWTGLADNMRYLDLVAGSLRELAATHNFELRLISERPPSRELIEQLHGVTVNHVFWRENSEIDDLHGFHIGLMPLDDSDWTRYKCGLKLLQYMATGIPAVVSPVGVNSEIVHNEQNGLLASTRDEWTQALHRLIGDAELRNRIGNAGRNRVEKDFSVARNVANLEAVLLRASNSRSHDRIDEHQTEH